MLLDPAQHPVTAEPAQRRREDEPVALADTVKGCGREVVALVTG
jgi:hypothetical protein